MKQMSRTANTLGGLLAAFVIGTGVAHAEPGQDPHVPNWAVGWCPGGGNIYMGADDIGSMNGAWGYCDGVPFDDGSFLHQVPQSYMPGAGATIKTFCRVGKGSMWAPPAPPGGCGGEM